MLHFVWWLDRRTAPANVYYACWLSVENDSLDIHVIYPSCSRDRALEATIAPVSSSSYSKRYHLSILDEAMRWIGCCYDPHVSATSLLEATG